MIDFDCREACKYPGRTYTFEYEGVPEFDGITFSEPLKLQAEYACIEDSIRITGSFNACIAMQCSRCLAPVAYPVQAQFSELFEPSNAKPDEDTYTFRKETNRVSLDQMVFDTIEADIPIRVLCSEDCKGLCPICGQNLNEGQCACQEKQEREQQSDSPFAKLKDLF